ncbi:MAG TPA: pantoate--beta-alanine ligase [Pirellulaceae bacterium]
MTETTLAVVTARDQVRRRVEAARLEGKTVGVVMTMGALHEGHFSLIRSCAAECDLTVTTVFVNPTQFGPGEDFNRYPRNLSQDLESLQGLPVDVVYAPEVSEVYHPSHSTFVAPPQVATPLEGRCRPGHFQGVCTVVLKLLHAVPAHIAYFGHKDYQQFLVVRQMAEDLDLETRIRVCPTVREPDGLAMSSRNQYLSPDERRRSTAIFAALELAQQLVQEGIRHVAQITTRMRETLHHAGLERLDYLTIADPESLEDLRHVDRRAIALIAAYVGANRLIDNRLILPR